MALLKILNTHAYPGCLVLAEGVGEGGAAHAEFTDGIVVPARYQVEDGGIVLSLDTYKTARGSLIVPKVWILKPLSDPGMWKITRRAREIRARTGS